MMTHDDITIDGAVERSQDPDRHRPRYSTFWPWLKQKYGFTDDQAGVDTFNLQPFLVDKTVAMQGYPSSEPYEAMLKQNEKVNFFLFADQGYPPYSNTLVANNNFIEKHPEAVAAFVKCSMLGWVDYFKNPAPANVADPTRQPEAAV